MTTLETIPPTENDAAIPKPGSWLLIGPRGAGKTSLVAALPRACENSRDGSPLTSLIPTGSPTEDLLRHRPDELKPSIAPGTYTFQLEGKEGLDYCQAVSILDTPGSLFETLARGEASESVSQPCRDLLRASRGAVSLAICFDASLPVYRPLDLHILLSRLVEGGDSRISSLIRRRLGEREPPWSLSPQLQIPFDRVLILFTKIDRLCDNTASHLRKEAGKLLDQPLELATVLPRYREITASRIPRLLDPIAMLDMRTTGLWNLAAALKPGGRLAVGTTSSVGLLPENDGQCGLLPFGIKEAALFALRGELFSPLEEIEVTDLSRARPAQYSIHLDMTQVQPMEAITFLEPDSFSADLIEPQPPAKTPQALPLKLPVLDTPTNRPSFLARLFRLDAYSDGRFLSYRAKQDLDLIARIFLILFVFELITWSFLFNAIFTGDILRREWSTAGAVIIACIFASGVLWFERQILTADTLRMKPMKRSLAMATRLLFILASVLAVAQPVELLLFRLPIQDRAHAEGIRKEAVTQLSMLNELESLEGSILETSPETELRDVQQQLTAARARKEGLASASKSRARALTLAQSRVTATQSRRESAQTAVTQAAGSDDAAERRTVEQAQAFADTAYYEAVDAEEAASQAAIEAAQELAAEAARVVDLERQEEDKKQELEQFKTRHALVLRGADRCRERLRAWIAQLQDADPGPATENWNRFSEATGEEQDLWPDEWEEPLGYSVPRYNFFEQVAVVWDLALSQPPTWPLGSVAIRDRLEKEFGLGDTGGGRDSDFFFYAFLGIHVLAAFFPMLIFTIKWFVMPKDLEDYYSVHHQAAAGNPEAIRDLVVNEEAKQRLRRLRGDSK